MLKLALIPIGAAVPALFFVALSLHISFPAAVSVVLSVLLFFPTLLLPLCDVLPKGKPRRYLQRIAEGMIETYLYLLIFMLADAFLLFFFYFAGLPPMLPVLFPVTAGLYLLTVAGGILHARVLKIRRCSAVLETGEKTGRIRAVVFSDLHLGFFTTEALLSRLGRAISEQNPDVILFAGDLFDSDFSELRKVEAAKKFLLSLGKAPLGVYMCEGNHDRYSEGEREKESFLSDLPLRILRDEGLILPYFELFGRRDRYNKDRLPASKCIKKGTLPVIVLDHQPTDAEALAYAGADLILCGHTHNGQTFPGNLLCGITGKYNYGYKRCKGARVLTTAGAGYWGLPMRLFTAGEIAVLDLTFEKRRDNDAKGDKEA